MYRQKMHGKTYNSTWIDWEDVENGGTIQYKLSNKPNVKWGTEIIPPSFEQYMKTSQHFLQFGLPEKPRINKNRKDIRVVSGRASFSVMNTLKLILFK